METIQVTPQTLRGIKNLAGAVIRLAFEDAEGKSRKETRKAEISSARLFLLGETRPWRESLQTYCDLAELDPEWIIRLAKKQPWYQEHINPEPCIRRPKAIDRRKLRYVKEKN